MLKADNGPGFISEAVRAFCEAHGIRLLHSPPQCPRYNGTCEVLGRWSKERAHRHAREHGRVDVLAHEDLEAALALVPVRTGVTDAERVRFEETFQRHLWQVRHLHGVAKTSHLRHHERAALERVALECALQECHFLSIKRRDFRL